MLNHIGTITLFDNMHCETWFPIKANAIHTKGGWRTNIVIEIDEDQDTTSTKF
jgi:hypothetical protein